MADAKITARSLLLVFLELHRMSPEFADWTEDGLADNPPRLFRLRQLVAMFRAFGIKWDPPAFVAGKFIDPQQPRHTAVLSKLVATMPERAGRWVDGYQLPDFFAILFDYREQVGRVLEFSGGVLEASGLYLHAYRKAGELNQVIQDNIGVIEDILVDLISPEAAVFSVEQLAQDFAYPDVDLLDIDLDCW